MYNNDGSGNDGNKRPEENHKVCETLKEQKPRKRGESFSAVPAIIKIKGRPLQEMIQNRKYCALF